MVVVQGNRNVQECLLIEFMSILNIVWDQIIQVVIQDFIIFQNVDIIKIIGNIMKINVLVCFFIGIYFFFQIGCFYNNMLEMYVIISQLILQVVVCEGEVVIKMFIVCGLWIIKKEIFKFVEIFIDKVEDFQIVWVQMVF